MKTQKVVWAGNFNRPWHTTEMVHGNLVLNWNGEEVLRVESNKMSPEEARATRDMVVKSVNCYEPMLREMKAALSKLDSFTENQDEVDSEIVAAKAILRQAILKAVSA